MATKIFILSWFSYTESDNYLYSDIKTFTDEEKAMAGFESDCEKAYEECKWGSQWDEPEDERDEDCAYDVDESRDPGTYQVSSGAYDGYHVEVSIEEKEIEIPAQGKQENTIRTKKGIGDNITWRGDDNKVRTTKVTGIDIEARKGKENDVTYWTTTIWKGQRTSATISEKDIIK